MADDGKDAAAEGERSMIGQIIDADGQFTPDMTACMEEWDFNGKGLDYNVCAVFGAQSSGKSTLLNLLFKTNFETMDDSIGRQQTTQGLWVGRAEGADVVVMDVEGTDSSQRGEENMAFERKAALFSLALAEVLVVNMWYSDIGRYNAANYGLLKTVLTVHLQLFQRANSPKTLLLFVIRDHRKTPLDKLEGILKGDLDKIWNEIEKPEAFLDSHVGDFFDFTFAALPHYEYAYDGFIEGVDALRHRFYDPSDDGYVFKGKYKKNVPADGFVAYASGIWDVVTANKDLDLPTQKEMLALVRCEEIGGEVSEAFLSGLAPLRERTAAHEIVDGFGAKVDALLDAAEEEFRGRTLLYHRATVEGKGAESQAALLNDARHVFNVQATNIRAGAMAEFKAALSAGLAESSEEHELSNGERVALQHDYVSVERAAEEAARSFFAKWIGESIAARSDWSADEALDAMMEEVADLLAAERSRQMEHALAAMKDQAGGSLAGCTEVLLSPGKDMWKRLRTEFAAAVEANDAVVAKQAASFGVDAETGDAWSEALGAHLRKTMRKMVADQANRLVTILTSRFDSRFRFDEHRVPRVWHPEDQIDREYVDARGYALAILPLFAYMRLDDDGNDGLAPNAGGPGSVDEFGTGREQDMILTPHELREVRQNFETSIKAAYVDAKRIQAANKKETKIPTWAMVLLVILGFNEFITVLTSPLLLFAVVFVGAGSYALYVMNLGGPAGAVVRQVIGTVVNQVTEQLGVNLGNGAGGAGGDDSFTPPPSISDIGGGSGVGSSSSRPSGSSIKHRNKAAGGSGGSGGSGSPSQATKSKGKQRSRKDD